MQLNVRQGQRFPKKQRSGYENPVSNTTTSALARTALGFAAVACVGFAFAEGGGGGPPLLVLELGLEGGAGTAGSTALPAGAGGRTSGAEPAAKAPCGGGGRTGEGRPGTDADCLAAAEGGGGRCGAAATMLEASEGLAAAEGATGGVLLGCGWFHWSVSQSVSQCETFRHKVER
jgi:hypothetical protein